MNSKQEAAAIFGLIAFLGAILSAVVGWGLVVFGVIAGGHRGPDGILISPQALAMFMVATACVPAAYHLIRWSETP